MPSSGRMPANGEDFIFCWSYNLTGDTNLFDNIEKEGRRKLINVGHEIKKGMNILGNISQIVINVTEEYTTELQRLFSTMEKHKIKCELDRQLNYLYIVESSNEIFSEKSNDLFNTLSDMTNNYVNFKQISEIETIINEEKESNLIYICINLDVCRTFPAFSDHLAHLLNNIVRIPITRFSTIKNVLKEILRKKLGFLHDIMNEENEIEIIDSIRNATDKDEDAKNFFKLFAETLNKKYKLYKGNNAELTDRIKALILIIDLVDKAFEANGGGDAVKIEFDNVMKSLLLWAMDEEIDIKMVLKNFLHHIFEIIDFYWDAGIRSEVKLLIDIYMTGTMKSDDIVYNDLLCNDPDMLSNFILPLNIEDWNSRS